MKVFKGTLLFKTSQNHAARLKKEKKIQLTGDTVKKALAFIMKEEKSTTDILKEWRL